MVTHLNDGLLIGQSLCLCSLVLVRESCCGLLDGCISVHGVLCLEHGLCGDMHVMNCEYLMSVKKDWMRYQDSCLKETVTAHINTPLACAGQQQSCFDAQC